MQHEMRLGKIQFEKIKSGAKTIESRLYDEKRQLISLGDTILFRQANDERQEIKTKVIGLLRHDSFLQLMGSLPPAMFGGNSTEELVMEIQQFYSQDEEKKSGVVGIKIERI